MSKKYAQEMINFIHRSPSPFHAVDQARQRLESAGFRQLSESDIWSLTPKGKYFVTRNQSSIIAFSLGAKYKPGNGCSMIAAHTDSPCLKVRPRSDVKNGNFRQVAVELYGGGLWYTWFDRDLTVAGRAIVQQDSNFVNKLVNVEKPILRVPSLAIHLNRGVGTEGFNPNKENHTTPILCSQAKAALECPSDPKANEYHSPILLDLLAKKLGCNVSDIKDFELCVADTQAPSIGGAFDEYVFSPRLDNLGSSYCATQSLVEESTDESLETEENIRMVCLFDHEEVGSSSFHGAASQFVETVLKRICSEGPQIYEQCIHNSFLISSDMAHALHPNYPEKHEARHRPEMNKGIVIKYHSNQNYATTSFTSFAVKQIAEKYNVPIQEFSVRNDMPCGSTVGPIISTMGLRTVDIGMPQLSMHSIRETCGVDDVDYCVALMKGFFKDFSLLNKHVFVDNTPDKKVKTT